MSTRITQLLALLVSSALCAFPCFAEEAAAPGGNVTVRVRAVRASGMITTRAERRNPDSYTFAPELADLQDKLRKLHYRKFDLLDSKERLVPLNQRETITLIEGNELTVRPLYIKKHETADRHRVGMWINWKDQSGTEVLDTKMHFSCGENMLTGTDIVDDTGMILAIKVSPE